MEKRIKIHFQTFNFIRLFWRINVFQLCRSWEPFLWRLPVTVFEQQVPESWDKRQGRVHYQLRHSIWRRICQTGHWVEYRSWRQIRIEAVEGYPEGGGSDRSDRSNVAGFERWEEVTVGTWSFFRFRFVLEFDATNGLAKISIDFFTKASSFTTEDKLCSLQSIVRRFVCINYN